MIDALDFTAYSVFPTHIYEIQFDEDFIDASRKELDMFREVGLPSGVLHYYTSYNNPDRLQVGPTTNKLLGNVAYTMGVQMNTSVVLDNSWVNYVPRGCTHEMHRHGDDKMISAVLYYDDIGMTEFFDPRIQIYNEQPERINAKKGKCIIFPGWLMHKMPPHFEDEDRVTIAFNMMKVLK